MRTSRSVAAMHDALRKAFFHMQRAAARFGLDIRFVGQIPADTPDREYYRPRFEPWHAKRWQDLLRSDDPTSLVTMDRRYVLAALFQQALTTVEGDVIECGVYRGGTARVFADLLRASHSAKTLHLFDTFAGMPESTPGADVHRVGDFADTSVERVRAHLGGFDRAVFHPGYIPETFAGVDARFCFAHIDLDQYQATHAATQYVYERMQPGGFIVYDDYGFASCPGVRRAVDEAFAGKREVPFVLSTGQCVIFKAPLD